MPNAFAPGAKLTDMGMDQLGGDNVIFKRKYRWTFELKTNCNGGRIPPFFVKLASRPNLTVEETEINFLNSKMWIPGKPAWETITVTFYDLAGPDVVQGATALYSWIASTYNFTGKDVLYSQSSKKGPPGGGGQGYAATAYLDLYDGCGTSMESWELNHVWPQAVNFGELDYSSSEEVTLELTLRYSEVAYQPRCGGSIQACCAGC